mmetsp:Transcript_136046/g.254241  ORF Transcript_136046/g.254241 Transcript_136046/m.254241 type:complete len:204 (-) Transcript_136046:35-646(-)
MDGSCSKVPCSAGSSAGSTTGASTKVTLLADASAKLMPLARSSALLAPSEGAVRKLGGPGDFCPCTSSLSSAALAFAGQALYDAPIPIVERSSSTSALNVVSSVSRLSCSSATCRIKSLNRTSRVEVVLERTGDIGDLGPDVLLFSSFATGLAAFLASLSSSIRSFVSDFTRRLLILCTRVLLQSPGVSSNILALCRLPISDH